MKLVFNPISGMLDYVASNLLDVGVTSATAQYQVLTTGATPFTPLFSGWLLDGTTGGKTVLAVTNTKTLTLTATDNFNLTIPATGTAALLATAQAFTAAQVINVNSATAFLVEQDGVNDNTFIVDTTNNRVGIGIAPTHRLVVGVTTAQNTVRINGSGTANITPILSMFRSGAAEWAVGVGGTLTSDFIISANPTSYSDANLAAATGKFVFKTSGFLGIGINPLDALHISTAADPAIRISEAGSTTSYTQIMDVSADRVQWIKVVATGNAVIDIEPRPSDGTGSAIFRFFRQTNTSGATSFDIYRGNGTGTLNSSLAGNTITYLNAVVGNVAIGGTSAAGQLTVVGKSDQIQNIVKAFSTQTANVFELQTSAAAIVNSMSLTAGAVFNEQGTDVIDFRVESDTEANMLFLDSSADALYLGGTTNGVKITKGGDTVFIGSGSGLLYGSFYAEDIALTVAVAATDVYYPVTSSMTTGSLNGMTFQNASELLVATAGKYLVTWSMAIAAGSNDHVEGGVMINTTPQSNTVNSAHTPGNNDEVSVGGTGILTLAVNDIVRLCVENENDADDIIVHTANLTLIQIGA
jgi:hypothetical protein